MAVISVEGIEIYAFHGCYKEEQLIGTNFLVDVHLECDVTRAAQSDLITDTVNYQTVFELVVTQMAIPSHLLEHVAKRIIIAIKEKYSPQILSISVKVTKLNPPMGGKIQKVSVCLNE